MMNLKKIIAVGILLISLINIQAQPWMDLLKKSNSKKELTLSDYKKAFDTYWEPYNVQNGYYYENGVKKKAYGWKQFMRWYDNMSYKVDDKTGAFPKKSAQQVYNEFTKRNNSKGSTKNASEWTSLGTDNSAGGYAGIGRINCIAFHPTDNDTYWIGAPAGGLWKTTDNGSTWTCLTDGNDVLGVSSIIIPSDYETSKTIYIGTGDRDASDNFSIGVLKSTDDGQTWKATGLSWDLSDNHIVNRILLDPNDNNTLIAFSSDGIYKTTNGGNTWDKINFKKFIDAEYKPNDFTTLYAANRYGDMYKSTDGGKSWNISYNGNGKRVELAVTPDNNNIVYAIITDNKSGLEGIYKSEDSGSSYKKIYSTKNLLGSDKSGNGSGGQGFYDLSLAVSPNDENTVLVGGVNTWRSTDGGKNWKIIAHWSDQYPQTVHADVHDISYRKNGDVFECNDGGVYISSNHGTYFKDKSNGLVISQIYKFSVSQTKNGIVINGLQDNGTKLRSEYGIWRDVQGGDGMECIIDYTNHKIQYATVYYGRIFRTTDNWQYDRKEITPSGVEGAWVTPYIISPTNHNTIYAGYSDVWKTTDKGNSWKKISNINVTYKLKSMAISSDASVLYVASSNKIWKTTDDGTTWTQITNNLPVSYYTNISYISVKDDNPNHVWVTIGGYNNKGVFESTDGGNTWTNISKGLPEIPIYCVIQNKQAINETHLYAATELGVYFKKGNEQWKEYNTGLPKVQCRELEIYYNDDENSCKLYVATYGRGLWSSPLEKLNTNLPSVKTLAINNITDNSAKLIGEITEKGTSEITERGFVWGDTNNPTVDNNKIINSETTLGKYSETIKGLQPSASYFARAYAKNDAGISYGKNIMFNTNCKVITTLPFSEDFEGNTFPPICWETFRGANGLGTSNDWTNTSNGYNGSKAAYVKYEDVPSGKKAEDWLVSPAIKLPTEPYILSFFEKRGEKKAYGSICEIKVSTTSNSDIKSFTTISSYKADVFSDKYTEHIIDLSAYNGKTIYIAFVLINDNQDSWYIDNVKIQKKTGNVSINSNETSNIKIYPNPANEYINIDLGKEYEKVKAINIIDNNGKLILSKNNIDNSVLTLPTNHLTQGTYILRVIQNNTTQTFEVVISR